MGQLLHALIIEEETMETPIHKLERRVEEAANEQRRLNGKHRLDRLTGEDHHSMHALAQQYAQTIADEQMSGKKHAGFLDADGRGRQVLNLVGKPHDGTAEALENVGMCAGTNLNLDSDSGIEEVVLRLVGS